MGKRIKNYKYLHNHTRMWFASIWIFTLKLPWQKGAEFLKHLYDGDPASNTLSWRWVAGLQTKTQNYIAKSWNIEKYSNNRFSNVPLNENALPLEELKTFPLNKINYNENFIKKMIIFYYLKMIFALLREKIYLKAIKTLV